MGRTARSCLDKVAGDVLTKNNIVAKKHIIPFVYISSPFEIIYSDIIVVVLTSYNQPFWP